MSLDMRFPTMWYVQQAKAQTSMRIPTVWSEPLLVTWIFYEVSYWINSIWFHFLKGGCTGSHVPIRVKMPHCWKSHVAAHILKAEEMTGDSLSTVLRIRQENVVVTKEIKLIKKEIRYCKRRKFNKNKNNSLFNSNNNNCRVWDSNSQRRA